MAEAVMAREEHGGGWSKAAIASCKRICLLDDWLAGTSLRSVLKMNRKCVGKLHDLGAAAKCCC
jgi:hypothetical protein